MTATPSDTAAVATVSHMSQSYAAVESYSSLPLRGDTLNDDEVGGRDTPTFG
jgi:hypothetical protein